MDRKLLEETRDLINDFMLRSKYDHRPVMPESVQEMFPHMMENEQLRYSRFKFAVAYILQPRSIFEVGIGWGVSANAFIAAQPGVLFYGVDNAEMGVDPKTVLPEGVPYECIDTDHLAAFSHPNGPIDLIHIDGGHGREQKARDIVKALTARPEWILVDDINDVMVAAGTFDGLYKAARNPLNMALFGDSHTGNLLIHVDRQHPEYR